MKRMLHLKISLLFAGLVLMTGCLDENILNVSGDVEITPSYSLPLGPFSYDINEYLGSLNTVPDIFPDHLFYNDVRYPNPQPYIALTETIPYDFSSLSNDLDRIENLMFLLVVSNYYPTKAYAQVYFADGNSTVFDSVFVYVPDGPLEILPAPIDTAGVVIDAKVKAEMIDVPMSPYFIQNLGNIRYIIIKSIIYTTREDIPEVKFYTRYALHINIAFRIQLRLNTGDL